MGTVLFELSGDERKLLAALRKAKAGMEAVEKSAAKGIVTTKRAGAAANKLGKDLQRAGDKGKKAFGPTAIGTLAKYAGGFLTVATAVRGVTAAIRQLDNVRTAAAQRALESKQSMGALAQLAETPEEMDELVRLAKQIYAGGGGATLGEAARVAFSLQSAGVQKFAKLFTDLRSSGVIDQPDVMARAVKTMVSSFGAEEAGTVRQILSKAFAASKFNPAIVEPLLEAAAGAGSFARALGISDEEVLAATALQAEETGTPSGGGTRVTALLRQVGKITEEGTGEAIFKDKSLKEIILEIQRVAPTPGKLTDLLGERSESLAAFRGLFLKMEKYDVVLAEIKRSQDANTADTKIRLARQVPEVRAAELREQARTKKELGEIGYSIVQNLSDAVFDGARRMARERRLASGGGRLEEIAIGAKFYWARLAAKVKGPEAVLREIAPLIREPELQAEVWKNLNPKTPGFPKALRERSQGPAQVPVLAPAATPSAPAVPLGDLRSTQPAVNTQIANQLGTLTNPGQPGEQQQEAILDVLRSIDGKLDQANTQREGIKQQGRKPALQSVGKDI